MRKRSIGTFVFVALASLGVPGIVGAAMPSHCRRDCKQDVKNCLALVPNNKSCTGTKAEKKACRRMNATQRKACHRLVKLCKQQNPSMSGTCLPPSTTTSTTLPGGQGLALQGSVRAPAASLALLEHRSLFQRMLASVLPSAFAQSSDGLTAVPGANVLLFSIDNSGAPVGNAIAQTTTDSSGNWTLSPPPGTSLGSNLIVQASGNTTPAAVGQQNRLNCPCTAPVLNLTPISEFATQAIIAGITRDSSSLANFTVAEVNAIIQQVVSAARDPSLVGATIQDTITNIANAAGAQTQQIVDAAAAAGEASAPSGLGGTYNLIGINVHDQSFNLERSQQVGTASLDASAKTFTVNLAETKVSLNETCTGTSVCGSTFVRSTATGNNPISGAITLLSGNLIAFQPSNKEGGALGRYNASGDVIVITTDADLLVAIKQTGSAPTLSGNYQAAELRAQLSSDFSVAQGVPYSTGDVSNGTATVTISGTALSGSSTDNVMGKDIACTDNGSGQCSLSETLTSGSGGGSISQTVAVNDTGGLTLTGDPSGPTTGAVASGGNFFALASGHPAVDGDAGVVVGVKQGSGMDNSNLNGTYNFAGFTLELGQNSSQTSLEGGTITLDGAGTLTGNLVSVKKQLSSACNGAGACPTETTSTSSKSETPSGTYSVSATGAVTVVGGSSTITGFASPDGSLIVLTESQDGTIGGQNSSSDRGLFILIK